MALKTLLLKKRIDNKKKELEALRANDFSAREAELTQAIDEVETEEQRTEIESMVAEFDNEKAEHETAVANLEREIEELESALAAEEEAQKTDPPAAEPETIERKDETKMNIRELVPTMSKRDRLANIVTRDEVKDYLAQVRTAIKEKRAITNAGLTIPEVMLELIHEEILNASKLIPYVNLRAVSGTARQIIMGAVPEGVWTEMCANLNELTLTFNQVEVDGYKVGGYIAICNAVLSDSDVALANEIVTALGGSVAKGLDKAILFGTGTKMPMGIVTRLAQTVQPSGWPATAPAWADLHESNVLTLNIASATDKTFFKDLINALAAAKPTYGADGRFWVMTQRTYMDLQARALGYNAQGALVANTDMMPVVGGSVVVMDNIGLPDYEIIGGYGANYLLAERQGVEFASSDQVRFINDQTVFKGTARYDGLPMAGNAFVTVNYANVAPTTTMDFAADTANS